jgi:hypothetical protein
MGRLTKIFECAEDEKIVKIAEWGGYGGDNLVIEIDSKESCSYYLFNDKGTMQIDDLLCALLNWRNEKHIPYSPELKEALKKKSEEMNNE